MGADKERLNYQAVIGLFLLFSFSASPDIFLREVDDRNIFLIGVMLISQPFVMLIVRLTLSECILLLFLFIVFLGSIFHVDTRWSSNFYLSMFCFTYILYSHLVRMGKLTYTQYVKTVKLIIFLYFIVLIAQQIAVFLGLPVPLAGNYRYETPWKLSSLAGEPSHAALNVGILGYCFIEFRKKMLLQKGDSLYLFFIFWILLTNNSSTGFIIAVFLFFSILSIRRILLIIPLVLTIVFLLPDIEIKSLARVFKFISALATLDPTTLIDADHSGSYRLLPAFFLINNFDVWSIEGIFGYGNSYVSNFLFSIMPGTPEGHVAGGLAVTLTQNGLLAFLVFVFFSFYTTCRKGIWFDALLLILIFLFVNGLNNQVVWFGLMMLSTNKFFLNQTKFIKITPSHSSPSPKYLNYERSLFNYPDSTEDLY